MVDLNLGYTRLIIQKCREHKVQAWGTACILANVWWETNKTMLPVEEAYYLGSKAEAHRKKLRYYPWYGRGFIQLTWEENYKKAAEKLGLKDWTPESFMEPEIAADVAVLGMKEGWFTGKKLSDYETFYSARAIVNGDKNRLVNGVKIGVIIDRKAKEYLAALGVVDPVEENKIDPAPQKLNIWVVILQFIMKLFGR